MPLRSIANSPFLVEENTSSIAAVAANVPGGTIRLYPQGYRSTAPLSAVVAAASFIGLTYDSNGGLVRLNSAGLHGLTTAASGGASVFVTWTGGQGTTGWYPLTTITDSGTALTINMPYVSGTATFTSAQSTVTFSTYLATNPAPTRVTWTGHNLAPRTAIVFTVAGGTLPTGITASTVTYYVRTVIDANTFTFSDVIDGNEIVATSNGSGTPTVTATTPTVVTWASHGRSVGDQLRFSNAGGTLPTGIASGTTYFVRRILGPNTFTVSATAGGAEIACTTTGTPITTAILWYGTPAVTLLANSVTLASVTVDAGSVSQQGRLEINAQVSMTSSGNNKSVVVNYAGTPVFSVTYGGNTSVNLNKVLVPTGSTNVCTTATTATGHGASAAGATVNVTANWAAAQTVTIQTTMAAANEPVRLEYYDITAE